jgi:chromosome segregation ATPase
MSTEKLPKKYDDVILQMNERIGHTETAIESAKKDVEAQKKNNDELNKEIEAKKKMLQDFIESRNKIIKEKVAAKVEGMIKDAVDKKKECINKLKESEKQLQIVNETLTKCEASEQKHSTKIKRLNIICDEKKKHNKELKSGNTITRNCYN